MSLTTPEPRFAPRNTSRRWSEPSRTMRSRRAIPIRRWPLPSGHEFLDAPDGPDGRRVGLHLRRAYDPRAANRPTSPRRGSTTTGSFRLMPVRGTGQDSARRPRQSWFSHQSETAKPYYYSVYLGRPRRRGTRWPRRSAPPMMRFTFPGERRESAWSSTPSTGARSVEMRRRADRCRLYDAQQRRRAGEFPELVRRPLRQALRGRRADRCRRLLRGG